MLRLEMLPAECGDCLWLEYGDPGEPHIMLIDGGVKNTAKRLEARIQKAIRERRASSLHIDLLVVTHIDNDHIDGILKLLEEGRLPLTFGDIWFNGNRQLATLPPPTDREKRPDTLGGIEEEILRPDLLGLREGDRLSRVLADPKNKLPWNKAFGGNAATTFIEGSPPPARTLPGELKLTLLGPPLNRLRILSNKWTDVLGDFARVNQFGPTPEREDTLGRRDTWPPALRNEKGLDDSPANGASIALLAEYENKGVLLTGDAFAPDLEAALGRIQTERGKAGVPLIIEAMKVPHHGSFKNLTSKILEKVRCLRYLISTDGSVHRHPDHEALLRIIKYSTTRPVLSFNYSGETTRNWHDRQQDVLDQGFPIYDTEYPTRAEEGLVVDFG